MPVIPTRTSSSLLPYDWLLIACLTSVFLTTLYSTPAFRNSARSFVADSTLIPLKSRKTAAVILSNRLLISPIWRSFSARSTLRLLRLAHEFGRVDPHAGAHGRRDRDAPEIGSLGRRGLLANECVQEGLGVVRE